MSACAATAWSANVRAGSARTPNEIKAIISKPTSHFGILIIHSIPTLTQLTSGISKLDTTSKPSR
ncbi:hypothetical protein X961_5660 [Burkholderia pseudomallei MSHR5613]|nr:hypothetical protein X961_5660 [Burkholderia pseudomallei MSHR5613]KGX50327.1 hypothetical protein Y025_5426 [Burkholderia pseudomallei TSV32]